jgi:hypothetical protein
MSDYNHISSTIKRFCEYDICLLKENLIVIEKLRKIQDSYLSILNLDIINIIYIYLYNISPNYKIKFTKS